MGQAVTQLGQKNRPLVSLNRCSPHKYAFIGVGRKKFENPARGDGSFGQVLSHPDILKAERSSDLSALRFVAHNDTKEPSPCITRKQLKKPCFAQKTKW